MTGYKFEKCTKDGSVQYRLIHTGRFWNTSKDVFLYRNSSGVYVCSASYKGDSADSKFLAGESANKLAEILKKQGLNRKKLMSASFPKGADQRALDCWGMILSCISFSSKR
ncbi:hypothetical protein GF343_05115 [Candidatus Woesearchaeota archaeon]|nr:hypothetical protein [Candidatus Woesearchaeota archaeon]